MSYGPWAGAQWRPCWNNGYYRVDVQWTYRQDISANKTQVKMMALRVNSIRSGYGFTYTASTAGLGDFGGNKKTKTVSITVPSGGTTNVDMDDITSTITHNSDGSWPSGVYGWWEFNAGVTSYNAPNTGWQKFDVSGAVPAISRGFDVSVSGSEIGSEWKITVPSTTDLYYSFGSKTNQLIKKGASGTVTWIPSMDLCNEIPNATRGIGGIRAVHGGVEKNIQIILAVPDSVRPFFNSATVDPSTGLIKGVTTTKISADVDGNYGSKVTSITCSVEGKNYALSSGAVTIGPLSRSGNAVFTATDTRGRTATKSVAYSVQTPKMPSLTATATRYPDADKGTQVQIKYSYSVDTSVPNSADLTIEYSSGGKWVSEGSDTKTSDDTTLTLTGPFDIDNSHVFRLTLKDKYSSTRIQVSVAPDFTLMNFGKDGHSLAFGKPSTISGCFETALPIVSDSFYMSNDVRHYSQEFNLTGGKPCWVRLGTTYKTADAQFGTLKVYTGSGYNGKSNQQTMIEIFFKKGYSGTANGRYNTYGASYTVWGQYDSGIIVRPMTRAVPNGKEQDMRCEIWIYIPWNYGSGFYTYDGTAPFNLEVVVQDDPPADPSEAVAQPVTDYTPDMKGYPVGSIFMTLNNYSPKTWFGGTWTRIAEGQFLVGAGTGKKDANNDTLTFTAGQSAGEYFPLLTPNAESKGYGLTSGSVGYSNRPVLSRKDSVVKPNILPPHLAVYIWERTA